MRTSLSRREWLAMAAAAPLAAAGKTVIDTHIHLFEPDRFPYHERATYKPAPETLASYLPFAASAGITHAVIVHPEPYQDDHRYLQYCFDNEKPKGLFKGTILLDPIAPETPKRMAQLVKEFNGRICAMRIHATNGPGTPPTKSGAIKNRDLKNPAMKASWKAAADLGIAIQMHFVPHHAPDIGALCRAFPQVPVVLDHLGRAVEGPNQADLVMALAKYPKTYFKFSSLRSAKPEFIRDRVKPLVQRAVREFGAKRILWGDMGYNLEEYRASVRLFDDVFANLDEASRDDIRGINAKALYRFS